MISILAICGVAGACALLSLVIVARKWAFLGEGIGHSGFGGAGTAWMLMAFFPALDLPWMPHVFVAIFALGAALGMALLSRRGNVSPDVATGIFLVATVAWGFVGQRLYIHLREVEPAGFMTLFFGVTSEITPQFALAALCVVGAVMMAMIGLRREILSYCVDPTLAQVSGVRVGLIHYLLVTLVAITTIVGLQIVGTLLITALLVLPGATANLLSRHLIPATIVSLSVGVGGGIAGWLIHRQVPVIPLGPAFVLSMFIAFVIAYISVRLRRPD